MQNLTTNSFFTQFYSSKELSQLSRMFEKKRAKFSHNNARLKRYYVTYWVNILSLSLDNLINRVFLRNVYGYTDRQIGEVLREKSSKAPLVAEMQAKNRELFDIVKANFFKLPYQAKLYFKLVKIDLKREEVKGVNKKISLLLY